METNTAHQINYMQEVGVKIPSQAVTTATNSTTGDTIFTFTTADPWVPHTTYDNPTITTAGMIMDMVADETWVTEEKDNFMLVCIGPTNLFMKYITFNTGTSSTIVQQPFDTGTIMYDHS